MFGYNYPNTPVVVNEAGNGFDGNCNGGWIWVILILVLLCGNNWGGFGNNGSTVREEIAYGFDNNQVQNGIRQLASGICDSTYALNNAIAEGNYKTINALTQGFTGVNAAINDANNAQTIASMNNFNALQAQLADCCCKTQSSIKDIMYGMATDTCAINTNASNNTRDIIDSQNANTRAILEAIQQGKVDAMQDKIATLQAENNQLALAASQCAQTNAIVSKLQPCPIPAYIVQNPNCGCNGLYPYAYGTTIA